MPIDPITSSVAAQSLGNIVGQGITNVSTKRRQKAAFDNNVRMWIMQNEYNHPKMQMQRYQEAGLNPNLIYGQGTPGNATQLPKYIAPEYKFSAPDIMGMLGQYQQIKTSQAQEANISADTAIKAIDQEIRSMEYVIKRQEAEWSSDQIKPGKGTNYYENMQTLKELQKARLALTNQLVDRATTFNKYMDFSQVGGIAGDFMKVIMPIIQMLRSK